MAEINVTGASSLYMKVDISNVRQSVSGNSSTVKFVASMRQTSGNNWNQVPGVDFKVVVNGSTKINQTGFFLDVRNNVTQVFYTADIVIPHNTDGTKSFSWSFWFDPKGTWHTYKPTTLSGTQALPRIARVSNSTLSANTFDFGESFTVYTNQTDPSFTHTISYIRGTTVTSLATGVKTSKAVAIPTAQISNYTTATTASMKIRTSTYSGSTLVGNYDLDVTVKVPTWAVPTIGAVSYAGSNAVFTGDSQFIASKDRVKATVANVVTSYSSPIKTYLYRVQQRTTISMEGTANGATFPTFNFPATGSEVVTIQMAVVDARGRQSAWSTSPALRVHAYQPPSIGAMTITRNANVTTVNVRRNWSVTDLFEGGNTASPRNTGALVISYRKVGDSTWLSTGGNASGRSGVNSNVALTPSFSGSSSYEFQIKLTDKFQTTTASIIRIGTEFVPLDIGPKGIGVGKIHSDGSADLEVGTGGISVDGVADDSRKRVSANVSTTGWHTIANLSTGRAYATFVVTDITSGKHNVASFIASQTYGNSSINLLHGGAYGTAPAINHVRILRNSSDGVYGGGKLQIHTTGSATIQVDMWQYNINGWSSWRLTSPTYENSPSGWSHDAKAYITDITQGINKIDMKYGLSLSAADSFLLINTAHGNVTIGPRNTGHSHIYTDRPNFYFNKDILINGHGVITTNTIGGHIPASPHVYHGVYTSTKQGRTEASTGRITYGIAEATGNSTSTFNSLDNTVVFPIAFSTNTNYAVSVTYSISSNVTPVNTRMISVNIRDVTRTGFKWDARDAASGTSPSGGTKYTLHWIATGTR